ncbi:MAG: RDD family protein [Nitrososphaerota archaeon]
MSDYKLPFDSLIEDRALQRYWITRIVAYLIDLFLVSFFLIIVYSLADAVLLRFVLPPDPFAPLLAFEGLGFGLTMVIYATLAEAYYGKTLGKKLMYMHTQSGKGTKPSIQASIVRNISKIHWLLLLLDILAGLIARGDAHERYLDRIASTRVALA